MDNTLFYNDKGINSSREYNNLKIYVPMKRTLHFIKQKVI